jgi:hypothetical protein
MALIELAQAAEIVLNLHRTTPVQRCKPIPTFATPNTLLDARHQLLYINVMRSAVDAIFGVRPGSTLAWWAEGISLIQPQNTRLEFSMNEVCYLKHEMRHPALAPWRACVGLRTKPFDESEVEIQTELLRAALVQMSLDGTIDVARNIAQRDSMFNDVEKAYEAELRRQGIEY